MFLQTLLDGTRIIRDGESSSEDDIVLLQKDITSWVTNPLVISRTSWEDIFLSSKVKEPDAEPVLTMLTMQKKDFMKFFASLDSVKRLYINKISGLLGQTDEQKDSSQNTQESTDYSHQKSNLENSAQEENVSVPENKEISDTVKQVGDPDVRQEDEVGDIPLGELPSMMESAIIVPTSQLLGNDNQLLSNCYEQEDAGDCEQESSNGMCQSNEDFTNFHLDNPSDVDDQGTENSNGIENTVSQGTLDTSTNVNNAATDEDNSEYPMTPPAGNVEDLQNLREGCESCQSNNTYSNIDDSTPKENLDLIREMFGDSTDLSSGSVSQSLQEDDDSYWAMPLDDDMPIDGNVTATSSEDNSVFEGTLEVQREQEEFNTSFEDSAYSPSDIEEEQQSSEASQSESAHKQDGSTTEEKNIVDTQSESVEQFKSYLTYIDMVRNRIPFPDNIAPWAAGCVRQYTMMENDFGLIMESTDIQQVFVSNNITPEEFFAQVLNNSFREQNILQICKAPTTNEHFRVLFTECFCESLALCAANNKDKAADLAMLFAKLIYEV